MNTDFEKLNKEEIEGKIKTLESDLAYGEDIKENERVYKHLLEKSDPEKHKLNIKRAQQKLEDIENIKKLQAGLLEIASTEKPKTKEAEEKKPETKEKIKEINKSENYSTEKIEGILKKVLQEKLQALKNIEFLKVIGNGDEIEINTKIEVVADEKNPDKLLGVGIKLKIGNKDNSLKLEDSKIEAGWKTVFVNSKIKPYLKGIDGYLKTYFETKDDENWEVKSMRIENGELLVDYKKEENVIEEPGETIPEPTKEKTGETTPFFADKGDDLLDQAFTQYLGIIENKDSTVAEIKNAKIQMGFIDAEREKRKKKFENSENYFSSIENTYKGLEKYHFFLNLTEILKEYFKGGPVNYNGVNSFKFTGEDGKDAYISLHEIAELYHKHKSDGTNPALVNIVEKGLEVITKLDGYTYEHKKPTGEEGLEEKPKEPIVENPKETIIEKPIKKEKIETETETETTVETKEEFDLSPEKGKTDAEKIKELEEELKGEKSKSETNNGAEEDPLPEFVWRKEHELTKDEDGIDLEKEISTVNFEIGGEPATIVISEDCWNWGAPPSKIGKIFGAKRKKVKRERSYWDLSFLMRDDGLSRYRDEIIKFEKEYPGNSFRNKTDALAHANEMRVAVTKLKRKIEEDIEKREKEQNEKIWQEVREENYANLNNMTEITVEIVDILAEKYADKNYNLFLYIKTITPKVAHSLKKYKGGICFHFPTPPPPESIEIMGKSGGPNVSWIGENTLATENAEIFSRWKKGLRFFNVKNVSINILKKIVENHTAGLSIYDLEYSEEYIATLAPYKGSVYVRNDELCKKIEEAQRKYREEHKE